MALPRKSGLLELLLELLYGVVVQQLLIRIVFTASAWNCYAKLALQSYFMGYCMELSCKTCLLKLFFRLLRGTIVHELPFEAIP